MEIMNIINHKIDLFSISSSCGNWIVIVELANRLKTATPFRNLARGCLSEAAATTGLMLQEPNGSLKAIRNRPQPFQR